MIRVKVCGINTPAAMDAAVDAGADWVGFVFFPPSPRAVTPTEAAALSAHRPGGPLRVGLFVHPTDEEMADALGTVPLDVLQIHGTPPRVVAIRDRFGLPVWHVASVAGRDDLPAAAPGVDGLLLDAKPPPGAVLPGGNAQAFDWSVLQGWDAPLPWLLAGGLTPGSVARAIQISGAQAVDVSSGVERARGTKDVALVHAFVAAARGAASSP